MRENHNGNPHVVILGAGFGGLRAARELARKPVNVTLIDRNNYHLFQPLLYQVATSTISPDEIAYPIRATLRSSKNVNFFMAEVCAVDVDRKEIITDRGTVSYDYLVVALGGETNYYGIDSVKEHGFGLKSLDDGTAIRNHLLTQIEMASHEPDPAKRKALLTFVVVGGGPTGVECAGAISELVRVALRKDYPGLELDDVHVLLLEMEDRVLANMPASLSKRAADDLRRKHVDLRFGAAVESYDGSVVRLKDGTTIPASTVIWAAGVRASRLLDKFGLEQDRSGRIVAGPTLQVPGHPEIFVIGDAAFVKDKDGKPLPMLAPVAMQQAESVAKNILRLTKNEPLQDFTYRDPGIMATIGRSNAVVALGKIKIAGFIGWVIWLVVHIYQLIGFRNRLAVMLDWAWSYIFYERVSRLIGPS
ncbi:MAG: NAD(P)/FAD-dependent oxidoreductase [Chloroflexi bacterium]|nr:NAD(P)/FAD-dependent oxidoreductase [Chloroflexota bacterium]